MSKLYNDAAGVLSVVLAKKGTVRSVTFSSKATDKKACFALVDSTLRHADELRCAIDSLRDVPEAFPGDAPPWLISHRRVLLMLMLHDLAFSRAKRISGGGALKRMLIAHSAQLLSQLHIPEDTELSVARPTVPATRCFVRVNTLLVPNVAAGVAELTSQLGASSSSTIEVTADPLLGHLGVFELRCNDESVDVRRAVAACASVASSRHVLLQDLSSCMPPAALSPDPGSLVLDACAAPGNKSTMLAAMLGRHSRSSRVVAIERDAARAETMRQLVRTTGASDIIVCEHRDFLQVQSDDPSFGGRNVDYILLDPSCSGTGIVRGRAPEERYPQRDRLLTLGRLQLQMLRHAFTFAARRVVYSTCSVAHEEDEDVVSHALNDPDCQYHLVPALPDWPRRGDTSRFDDAAMCIRVDPQQDRITGFFVALFERNDVDDDAITIDDIGHAPAQKKQKKQSTRPTFDEQSL